MKKIYIFLFLLILASFSGSLTAQTTVTIGEGTTTSYRLPLNMYFHYSLTQEIYTAEEIGVPVGGTITSISFHYAHTGSFNLGNIQVFLMNTSKSSFESTTDMVPISFDNMVYDGNLSASGSGWLTLTLDQPFEYDGRNLLVCLLDTISGYPGTSFTFYTTTTTGNRAISWYSDSQRPNLNAFSSWSGSRNLYSYRADIRFDITPNSQEVAIGTGIYTTAGSPYQSSYSYSFVEQIYTAEEIGLPAGGSIQSVSFNMQSTSPQTNHITLYMKQVSRSTFSSNTDFEPVSTSDVVYEGDFTFSEGWNTITLDVPFEYDGTSNLMVAMHENTPGNSYRNFYYTYKYNSVIYQSSYDTDPDPYNLSAWNGNIYRHGDRSNIKLGVAPNTVVDYPTIGEGTDSYYRLPVDMYYNYSLTQQIYKAEEINVPNGGTIDSLSFHYAYSNSFTMNNVKLYLLNTTKNKFSSNTDMVSVTESNRVWQGTFSASGAGWITIHFDTPFNYTGGNLLVCFLDTTYGYPGSNYKFYTTPTTDTMAISWYSDGTQPTIGSTSFSGSKTFILYRNNIRIGITPNPCPEPTNLHASAHPSSASLYWSGDHDRYNLRCRPAQVYLSENFEGSAMPAGWSSQAETGSGVWSVNCGDLHQSSSPIGAAAGHYNARITHTSTGNTTYLISPVMDLSGAANATLNFSYINRDWSGDIDSLDVYYRVNGGAWQLLFHTAENHETWTNESLTLPNLANNYQIAFKMTDGYGYGVGIDEVQVYEISSGTWTIVNGLTNSYYDLSALSNNTTYIWQVQGLCAYNNSLWSPFQTFTTNCDMVQTPYTESFETEGNFSCWTPIAGTRRYNGTTYNGSYSLQFKGTTDNLILLPDIDNAIQEVKISFYLRPESYTNAACGTFEFGYLTDPTNINSFVTVNSYSYSDWASNGYAQRTEYLTELPDNAILAFRHHPTDTTSGWYVDNVNIDNDEDLCRIPYHLTATNVSANSVTLNWEARGDETAWNLYYRKSSESGYTFVSNITKPYNLTGLESGTRYQYYVRALCTGYSSSSSNNSEIRYFTTECDVTVPYTETFESGDATTCWTLVSGSAERSSSNNHAGNYKLLFSGSLSNIIALPELDQDISNLQLSFWTRPESCTNSYCGTFDVGYMTDPSDASTFVAVATYNYNDWTSNTYEQKTEYFPSAPSGARIAFRHNANATSWYWYVDDVEVTNPGCMAPHQLRATNISNTSVTLDWTPRAGDSYWKIYYKKTTESSYSNTMVSSHPYMIDGLTAGATYEFKVQTLCTTASDFSESINITTGCGSNPIPYAYDFETVPPMECWTALTGTIARHLNNSVNHTPGGAASLRIQGDLHRVVTLPEFDQPISNLQLSFWTRPESYANSVCGTFDVGYLTNPTDTSTFVVVNTYRYNDWTSNTNVNKVEYFPNAPAGSRMAFRHNALSTIWYWFVDDVEVTEAPACIAPYHLAATTSSTSASLDWTPRGNETSWTIYYKKTGASSYSSQSTSYHPRTIYNLEEGAQYQFYVKASCGNYVYSAPSDTVTFTPTCAQTIPYAYDFENSVPFMCWDVLTSSSGRSSGSYNHTSGGNYYLYFGYAYRNIIAMPQFDQPINNLQVTFWTRPESNTNSNCGTFDVGYLTNPTDTSTFVAVSTYSYNDWSSSSYQEKTEYFAQAPAGARIAFRHNANSTSWYWFVDDIVVTEAPACIAPFRLTANVNGTTAVLDWTARDTESSWNLYYRKVGDASFTTLNQITKPYTLNGLDERTQYEYYVVAYCGSSSTSIPSDTCTFTTTCAPQYLPYTYGFETQDPFACWYPVNGTVAISSSYYHTGFNGLQFSGSNPRIIAMPTLEQPISNLQLSFWTRPEASSSGTFDVGYMTDLSDPSSFVVVNTYTYDNWSSSNTYRRKTEYFDGAPANALIAFRNNSSSTSWDWYVDDVEVSYYSCKTPNQLTLNSSTANSVTVDWTARDNETAWKLYYRKANNSFYTTVNVTSKPYTLTGLEPNTAYECYVNADCGGGLLSNPSDFLSFITECDEQTIPYQYAFEEEAPFRCWHAFNGNARRSSAYSSSGYENHTAGGSYYMAIEYGDVVRLPQFDQPISDLQISLWIYPEYYSSYVDTFSIGYLTNPDNAESFVEIASYVSTDWENREFKLKMAHFIGAPGNAVMALRSKGHGNMWYVDDVEVTLIPVCDAPEDLDVDNISTESATLYWTSENGPWDIMLNGTLIENVSGSPYTFTNLTSNTTYQVKVRSFCEGVGESEWSEAITFTTDAHIIPSYITFSGNTAVCPGGSTIITASSNVPGTYVWDFGTTGAQVTLTPGTYTVTITTSTGDQLSSSITIVQNPTYAVSETRSVCPSALPYTWNGKTFTNAGTQTAILQTVNGCDSVVTMTLTVNPTYNVTDAVTVCETELPYTWYDLVFSEAGTQTTTLESMDGCDSVVTMTLTVNPTYNVSETRSVCPGALPYTWNGKTFTGASTQTATLQTVNGCDSVVTMTLTINDAFNITEERSVCLNEMPYTWNGKTFTNAGTQTATLQSVAGCDSIVTMILTVNPTYNVTDAMAVCQSELPYTWNGKTFTAAGTQTATLQTVNGCDSVVTMTLTVNPTYNVTDAMTVCENELPYTWYDLVFSEAGTQTITLESMDGCDSVVTMTLTLYPSYEVTDSRTVCPSALPYTWNGKTFTAAGTQTATLQTVHGCDSVVTMTLTVNDAFNVTENRTVCQSELPYTWNGKTFTAAGTQTATLQSVAGCDSIVTMTLVVNPTYQVTASQTICQSELPYTWNGKTFTAAGTQTATLQAVNGCDSVVTMTLTVNPTYNVTDAMTVCENELPYTWYDLVFTGAGTQTITLESMDGCDSVVTMTLTLYPTYEVTESRTICQSELPYTWNGKTFTAAGTQTATLETVNGCDSVVTMTLTVHTAYTATDNQTICQSELPYTWNGTTFTAAGTQTATLQTVNGCDSIVTMTLNVNPSYNVSESQTVCQDELPYTWNGVTFTAAGMQTATLQSVNGCDSTVIMTLFVNPTYSVTENRSICQSELPYSWNNMFFYSAGTKVAHLQSVNGCDSTVTMILTVNQAYLVNDSKTICQNELPYTWNDVTFISAGTLVANLETVNGCDSVVTMTLAVNPTYNVTDNRTICQNELPYTWNGQTFTAAGTQTATLETVNGCDSVVTMTLTVNPSYQVTASQTICQSELPYTWNGQTFTAAGTQTVTLETVNGCDSVVTMTLTVNPTYQVTASQAICQNELPYTWNGQTFTSAGTQTATLQTVNGCDSVVIMTLTVNPTPVTTLYDTICEGEHYAQYGFDTIPGSYGTYQLQRVLPSALGCDSTVTLMLMVGRSYLITEEATTCDNEPYAWHGHTYATAGVYYDSLQTVNGCDSICVLTLTTTPSYEIHVLDTATRMHEYVGYGLTLMPVDTGVFEYEVQNYTINGCDSIIYLTLFVQNNTGIVDHDESIPEFTLFPNPAVTYVNITGEQMEQVYVYNALGQLMMAVDAESDTHVHLELHDYPVGQYVVNIKLTDGRTVQKKMIIRR